MRGKLLQALLSACQERGGISRQTFILRLLIHPRMFFITVFSRILSTLNLTFLVSARSFWGRKIKVVLPEVVSSEILRFGYIDEAVASAIILHAKEGGIAIDVGGHFGLFSLLLAEVVGEQGKVYVFEPVPSTFAVLSVNCLGMSIIAENMAVLDKNGQVMIQDCGVSRAAFNSIRGSRDHSGRQLDQPKSIAVRSVTLDDYSARVGIRPDFIKIDAESAEYEVIRGMHRLLSDVKPVICIELGDLGVLDTPTSRSIVDILLGYGYRALEWDGKLFRTHTPVTHYAYTNLLFLPRSSST
jgi:FkbM family methyltransferase